MPRKAKRPTTFAPEFRTKNAVINQARLGALYVLIYDSESK
jgi:hypothetical protein